MALCRGCGNEVDDVAHCPICLAGRAVHKAKATHKDDGRCRCPRCHDPLDEQDWDGTLALTCPSCRGSFFPEGALEVVLNKLRATVDPVDAGTAFQELKDRFTRELPDAIRYKPCPVCANIMLRRNYATVSGVIVDQCADHGTWVDEACFAALADFICRGGDVVAKRADDVRARLDARPSQRHSSLYERFFGQT